MVNGARIGLGIGAGVTAGTGAAALGLSWWYAAVLTDPRHRRLYPDRLLSADERQVALAASRLTEQPGTWGLRWAEGLSVVGPIAARRDGAVIRPLLAGPVPPRGPVAMDVGPYEPDPRQRGIEYTDVEVATPLGPCPAWLVPPPSDGAGDGGDWVVMVHGRRGTRREALRVLPVVHAAGRTALVVTYRNDVDEGAPPSPDGHDHLGDTEWADLEAAIRFATDRGARRIVLFGWSMGCAISAAFLDRSPLADVVVAMVWDAPLVDWRATLRQQARNRRFPPSIIALVTRFTRRRIGIDFDRFDMRERPPALRPPTLVLMSDQDTAVPPQAVRDLVAAAPELGWLMRYVEMAGVEHTAAWNADPQAYEQAVAEFLADLPAAEVR